MRDLKCDGKKTGFRGCRDGWLSSEEHLLLLQRTTVWVPEPRQWLTTVTPVQGICLPLLVGMGIACTWCTYIHACKQIDHDEEGSRREEVGGVGGGG